MSTLQKMLVNGMGEHDIFWPSEHTLQVSNLLEKGWKPTAFHLFLFKIVSRCNLNCNYCFVYNMADQSWRLRPRLMDFQVVSQALMRIREHVLEYGLKTVTIVLHGGEPLLAGVDYLREFIGLTKRMLCDISEVRFGIQTNGTLFKQEIAELFLEHRVKVGFSLDGDQDANDQHRVYHNGKGSYDDVRAGLSVIQNPRYASLLGIILCVVNLKADPLSVYHHLLELNPPTIDFLLPHGNWTEPPPGKNILSSDAPYADWLIPIFDEWYFERPKRLKIRFFEEIINMVLGGRSGLESIGTSPVNLLVIETDGTLEGVDSLKSTFEGAAKLSMNVFDNGFSEALMQPSIVARQIGIEALPDSCQNCKWHRICGAGYYPHRFDERTGFRNPSVYCTDLMKLIQHIYTTLYNDLLRMKVKA